MPKVSICIPTYNQIECLRKTLDSVQSQTFHDYEVIITDDSPNNTVTNLIKQYDFNGKLTYFHNAKALGSPENWNYCISKAAGDYIKILHHDDWFTYDYSLQEYVKLLDDNKEASMAFSGSIGLLEDGYSWVHSLTEEQFRNLRDDPTSLYLGNKIGGPSAIIFKKNIGIQFDPNLKWLVDVDFYIKMFCGIDPIAHTEAPLITTFAAPNRVTNFCANDKIIEIFEHFFVLNNIVKTFRKLEKSKKERCYNYTIQICEKYGVTRVRDIKNCGFSGTIPVGIRQHLFTKRMRRFISIWRHRLMKLALIKTR